MCWEKISLFVLVFLRYSPDAFHKAERDASGVFTKVSWKDAEAIVNESNVAVKGSLCVFPLLIKCSMNNGWSCRQHNEWKCAVHIWSLKCFFSFSSSPFSATSLWQGLVSTLWEFVGRKLEQGTGDNEITNCSLWHRTLGHYVEPPAPGPPGLSVLWLEVILITISRPATKTNRLQDGEWRLFQQPHRQGHVMSPPLPSPTPWLDLEKSP